MNDSQNLLNIRVSKEDLEYINESLKSGEVLKEDLRRWFKEKWVDVSRKVDGKHPPCGRSKATTKGYPKCRPSKKVSKETPKTAGSFSKKEKKSMTTQKRRAEKKEPKTGTGHKPTMTHYDENINELNMNTNIQNKIVELVLDEIHELHENRPPKLVLKESIEIISEGLIYHINNNKPLTENVYRVYSNKFFNLFNEARNLYKSGTIEFFGNDLELIKTDIGKVGLYEGQHVFLDIPFIDGEEDHLVEAKHRGKNVKLNKPFRTPGGPKKFAVYVKTPGGNIKKVTFGDPNLRVRNSNKKAAKSFRARHKCSQKKDRTTAGYWSCNLSRYSSSLGLSSKRKW